MAEVRSTKGEDFFEEAPVVKENNEALDKVTVAPASEPVIVRKTNKSPVILGVIILSVVLAVIIALVCIGFATKNQGEMELLYEEVQGGIAITGVKNCGAEVVIPSEINGKPVVKIGERAFFECTNLTSVVIPNSVTSIGYFAFEGCEGLARVDISDISAWCNISFSDYDSNPLYYAKNLYLNSEFVTDLVIPNSVTSIGNGAFVNCTSLTSVVIPNSVTSIGYFAFSGCDSLTSIEIPSSVTSIDYYAFSACTSLTNIVIPNSVMSIGEGAFYRCTSLTSVAIPSRVTTIGDNSFSGCENLASIEIPNSVTTIGDYAFEECTGLTSIAIPNSVTTIGYSAFDGCESLEKITVPFVGDGSKKTHFGYIFGASSYIDNGDYVPTSLKKVTVLGGKIEDNAFEDCTGLANVTIPNSATSIGSHAFYGCEGLTSVEIPSKVRSIGGDAFSGCYSLTRVDISDIVAWCNISFNYYYANPLYLAKKLYLNGELVTDLVIPEGVTTIGNYAFSSYPNLTSVTIPNSVTTIGWNTFGNCTSLTSVMVGDGVTSIGEEAFENCVRLTNITIGDSIANIGYAAFWACTSLTRVDISDISAWCNISFGDYSANPLYHTKKLYLNGELVTDLVIPSGVTTIGERAFINCTNLGSVTIPDSVTTIGNYAFENCTNLSSVTIPDSVTTIGDSAFYGCEGLTRVDISDIGAWCNISFSDYDSTPLCYAKKLYLNGEIATDLVIPNGVTTIGDYAFYGCDSLTSVAIEDSVTTIGRYAFDGCHSLTRVDIRDMGAWCNVTFENEYSNPLYYGKNLYLNSELVTNLVIPSGVTTIGEYAFFGCTSFTRVEIPNNVTTIGYSAFEGCEGLEEMTVPFVGDGRFETHFGYIFGASSGDYAPASLKKVTVLGGTIEDDAFDGCKGLTNVTLGDSVTTIGGYVFEGCENLISIEISNSVTSIGDSAFYGCEGLTRVDISDIGAWCNISFSDYDSNPLYYAKNLYLNGELVTDLVIPDSVTSIVKYAFYGCYNLTSVTIPDSVISIGYSAFEDCTSLTRVDISDIGAWCNISFDDYSSNPLYHAKNLYLNGELVTDLVIPDGVTTIGKYAFRNCTSITSVTIGNDVTAIGDGAFENCGDITRVEIPNSVTSIGSNSFYDCNSLEEMTVPFVGDGIYETHFGYIFGAFSYSNNGGCVPTSLKKVTVLSGEIGSYAFYGCNGLTSVTISDSTKSIGWHAFEGCESLTSVEIPNSVDTIGYAAFEGCNSLGEMIVPFIGDGDKNTHFGYIFGASSYRDNGDYVPTSLKKVTVLGGKIEGNAFEGCESLTSVTLGDGVTSIGEFAFDLCSGLTSVTIPNSVTTIGDNAFTWCDSLTIYCEAESQPSDWSSSWNSSNCPVVWGYKEN